MNIAISNLCYQGLFTNRLLKLPADLGIEVYSETGTDFYWDHLLPKLFDQRTGPFTVHGPYQNIDLSDPKGEEDAVYGIYEWTFNLCKRHGAVHCVLHPYAYRPVGKMSPEEIGKRKEVCLLRTLELSSLAKKYDVTLLVENMPDPDGLLDQAGFEELFLEQKELNFLIDTGHAHIQKWNMDRMFEKMGNRILGYHINDNMGDKDSHLKVGEGSYDWEKFFALYNRYTPEATLVLEYMKADVDELTASARLVEELARKGRNV